MFKDWKEKLNIELFKQNLQSLFFKSKQNVLIKRILFLLNTNVNENITCPVSWKDIYYKNSRVLKYNDCIKNFCNQNYLEYFDLFGTMQEDDLYDWVHPNSNWHKKIYEKVKEFLEKEFDL